MCSIEWGYGGLQRLGYTLEEHEVPEVDGSSV